MDTQKIENLIDERAKLHPNDPETQQYWDNIVAELGDDEGEIIEFISSLDDERLFWISEVFEDLSAKLKSKTFVEALYDIEKQHPNVEMVVDIEFAKAAIE